MTTAGPQKAKDAHKKQQFVFCWYLVGVEYFAGEGIVFQGAGGAGAAVV